jgi:hypothetical protein
VTREQLRLGTDPRGWGHLDCYHHQVEFSHARGEVVQKNTHTTVPEPINLYTFKTLKSARHQETLAVWHTHMYHKSVKAHNSNSAEGGHQENQAGARKQRWNSSDQVYGDTVTQTHFSHFLEKARKYSTFVNTYKFEVSVQTKEL